MKFSVDYDNPRYIELCDTARITETLAHIVAERIASDNISEENADMLFLLEELTHKIHDLANSLSRSGSEE